jgi:hypothetical protein
MATIPLLPDDDDRAGGLERLGNSAEFAAELKRLDGIAARVPRDLGAKAWFRWRAQNPPPWLRPENRLGEHCGHCGEPLTVVTRLCVRCYEADSA